VFRKTLQRCRIFSLQKSASSNPLFFLPPLGGAIKIFYNEISTNNHLYNASIVVTIVYILMELWGAIWVLSTSWNGGLGEEFTKCSVISEWDVDQFCRWYTSTIIPL